MSDELRFFSGSPAVLPILMSSKGQHSIAKGELSIDSEDDLSMYIFTYLSD